MITSTAPARDAYEHIAPFYDAFTAHHDYELWLGNLLEAAWANGLRGNRLLDVGCGTGASFMPMLERGWRVRATDLSPAMAARASAKAGARADVGVADMRSLPAYGEFDLVWCLDDAINYLASTQELTATLGGLRGNLAPDGLLIFDVNTLLTYRTFFAGEQEVRAGAQVLRWQGRASAGFEPGSTARATFTVEAEGGAPSSADHEQRHFPPLAIREGLACAGLELIAEFGHGYDAVLSQPLDEAVHTKAIYLCRRHR